MSASVTSEFSARPTVLACPRCSGALYEIDQREATQFCCDLGHRFTADEICPSFEDFGCSLGSTIDVLIGRRTPSPLR